MKSVQQCCAKNAKGDRCSRYCAAGDTVCAKHQKDAAPTGVIAQQDTDDVRVLLKRLTKDRDSSVRLRAIEAILRWEEREQRRCAVCDQRAASAAANESIVAHATYEQRAQFARLLGEIATLKAQVLAYVRAGGTPIEDEPVTSILREPSAPATDDEPSADPTVPEVATVSVWRDGQLTDEPRRRRNWKTA